MPFRSLIEIALTRCIENLLRLIVILVPSDITNPNNSLSRQIIKAGSDEDGHYMVLLH